jgi:hypothetical protein
MAFTFGPNEVTGENERRETEHDKDPDREHLPTQTVTSSAI